MAVVAAGRRRRGRRTVCTARPHEHLHRSADGLRMPSVRIFRWRFRGMKLNVDERELGAAADDILDQLRPRRVLRGARDPAIKFQNADGFRDYLVSRAWAVLPVVLVFFLVSTIFSIAVL